MLVSLATRRNRQGSRTFVHGAHCLAGVPDQIQENLLELNAVPRDVREVILEVERYRYAGCVEVRVREGDGVDHKLVEIEALGRQRVSRDGLSGRFPTRKECAQPADDFRGTVN